MLSVPNLLGYLVTRSKALPLGIQPVRLHTSYHNAGVLLEMVKAFIPPLLSSAHKGECGRIGVVGGCQEYTGAPYFAAISALKLGADLSHVFCTKEAAPVIKSYSPELIVHPLLDSSNCAKEIEEWLPRLHAIVLGPGLGRSVGVLENACSVIQQAKERRLPLVVDADGLFLVTQDPQIIAGYDLAILTPNVAEFARLYEKVMGEQPVKSEPISCVKSLCSKLGNVTIVHKGEADIISNGKEVLVCTSEGSARRCGGQGDLLSGSMGTFVYWALRVYNNNNNQGINKNLSVYGPCISGAYAACLLTRECNRRAFMKHRRSMTTSDMITVLQEAFEAIYE